jgi:prepilin-type N-terminal cleavage/methylation domain-containing protein
MDKRKGFSLVEGMVVMVLMVMIMSAIYLMIMYYRDVSGTEQARVRQTQESRYLMSVFSSELKNAGTVLTLTNTGGFLSVPPYFNGIYPLNNTGFPDGVVVASGDHNAVSKLVTAATPSDGILYLNNTNATPAWAIGDQGILIGPDGFYVFAVSDVDATSIDMEGSPVYFSGLLNTDNYNDPETVMGDAVEYPVNSPVMRLSEFSIYLVQERYDDAKKRDVRELVRISDCHGKGDVLTNPDPFIVKGVIAENVWDMQLVYTAYPNFPDVTVKDDYFTSGGGNLADLLTALRIKTMKEITVNVVVLTDDYPGKGTITYPLPLLADRAATSLPAGKFNFKTFTFLVQPRNFNIKI